MTIHHFRLVTEQPCARLEWLSNYITAVRNETVFSPYWQFDMDNNVIVIIIVSNKSSLISRCCQVLEWKACYYTWLFGDKINLTTQYKFNNPEEVAFIRNSETLWICYQILERQSNSPTQTSIVARNVLYSLLHCSMY